ncbi:hypothetical protein [Gordonia terrae]
MKAAMMAVPGGGNGELLMHADDEQFRKERGHESADAADDELETIRVVR